MPETGYIGDFAPADSILVEHADSEDGAFEESLPGEDAKEAMRLEIAHEILEASSWLGAYITTAWTEFDNNRDTYLRDGGWIDSRSFGALYREREKTFANRQEAPVDGKGRYDPKHPNAHMIEGLSSGLLTDAVTTVGPHLIRGVVGKEGLPVEFVPVGSRGENSRKKSVAEEWAKRDLEASNWRGEICEGLMKLPLHGTAFFRQRWCETTELVNDGGGVLREKPGRRGIEFRHWSPLNVVYSNPERPFAWEQDVVIWRATMTLGEIWRNRRRYDGEETIRKVEGRIEVRPISPTRGRYTNLEAIFEAQAQRRSTVLETQESTIARAAAAARTSSEYMLETFEIQGAVPIGSALRGGMVTRRALEYLMPDPILLRDSDGNDTAPDEETFMRIADMASWYATVAQVEGKGWVALDLRICPYRQPRNELISTPYVPSGGLHGYGVDHLAGDVGDAADKFLNYMAKILSNHASPTAIVERRVGTGADDSKPDELNRIMDEGGTLYFNSDAGSRPITAADVASYLLKPFDPAMVEIYKLLVQLYNSRAMSSQVGKGAAADTGTDTASEITIQQRGLDERLGAVVNAIARTHVVVRSMTLWLKDLDTFRSAEELEREATALAGRLGLGTKDIWPTGLGDRTLEEEFIVRHIGDGTLREEVQAQFAERFAKTFMQVLGPKGTIELLKVGLRAQGLDPDQIIPEAPPGLTPQEEFEMLVEAGDKPVVSPNDDDLDHLESHMEQLGKVSESILSAQATGGAIEKYEFAERVLQEHIDDTLAAISAKMAAAVEMQRMRAEAAAGGKGGGKPNPGESQPGAAPAANQDRIAMGIQAGAGVEGGAIA